MGEIAGFALKGAADPAGVRRQLSGLCRRLARHAGEAPQFQLFPDGGVAGVADAGGDCLETGGERLGIVFTGHVRSVGGRPSGASDAALVLNAYRSVGPDAFNTLDGSFAFILWDGDDVYVVRDRFGTLPLFLHEDGLSVRFATSIDGLLGEDGAGPELSAAGVSLYMALGYVPAPHTLFEGVTRLEAGAYLRLREGAVTRWSLSGDEEEHPLGRLSRDAAFGAVADGLAEAVRGTLPPERPAVLLLGGGIGSAALAVAARGSAARAVALGFPDLNEFPEAEAAAAACGLPLDRMTVEPEQLIDGVPRVLSALDVPSDDPFLFTEAMLLDRLEPGTALLSGLGADELFLGNPEYRTLLDAGQGGWWHETAAPPEKMVARWSPALLRGYAKHYRGRTRAEAAANLDLRACLPEKVLQPAASLAMGRGIGLRFPFLSRPLLELVRSLPQDWLLPANGLPKQLLRDSFAGSLPQPLIGRAKLRPAVSRELLLERHRSELPALLVTGLEFTELLRTSNLNSMLRDYFAGDRSLAVPAWRLTVLLQWYRLRLETDRTSNRLAVA